MVRLESNFLAGTAQLMKQRPESVDFSGLRHCGVKLLTVMYGWLWLLE